MFRSLKYIQFLFSSTNHHGVHSPFVYNFVTKCLYKKERFGQSKSISVLLKSIAYFTPESIRITDKDVENIIVRENNTKIVHPPYDLVYYKYPDTEDFIELQKHNNTVVIVDNIYLNKKKEKVWQNVKNLPFVIVTVDMFYCGAVFFRKEQEKEHFKIRI